MRTLFEFCTVIPLPRLPTYESSLFSRIGAVASARVIPLALLPSSRWWQSPYVRRCNSES
jgi:hypothetical protein